MCFSPSKPLPPPTLSTTNMSPTSSTQSQSSHNQNHNHNLPTIILSQFSSSLFLDFGSSDDYDLLSPPTVNTLTAKHFRITNPSPHPATVTCVKTPSLKKGLKLCLCDALSSEAVVPANGELLASIEWLPSEEFGLKGVREVFLFKIGGGGGGGKGRMQVTVCGKARKGKEKEKEKKIKVIHTQLLTTPTPTLTRPPICRLADRHRSRSHLLPLPQPQPRLPTARRCPPPPPSSPPR